MSNSIRIVIFTENDSYDRVYADVPIEVVRIDSDDGACPTPGEDEDGDGNAVEVSDGELNGSFYHSRESYAPDSVTVNAAFKASEHFKRGGTTLKITQDQVAWIFEAQPSELVAVLNRLEDVQVPANREDMLRVAFQNAHRINFPR